MSLIKNIKVGQIYKDIDEFTGKGYLIIAPSVTGRVYLKDLTEGRHRYEDTYWNFSDYDWVLYSSPTLRDKFIKYLKGDK